QHVTGDGEQHHDCQVVPDRLHGRLEACGELHRRQPLVEGCLGGRTTTVIAATASIGGDRFGPCGNWPIVAVTGDKTFHLPFRLDRLSPGCGSYRLCLMNRPDRCRLGFHWLHDCEGRLCRWRWLRLGRGLCPHLSLVSYRSRLCGGRAGGCGGFCGSGADSWAGFGVKGDDWCWGRLSNCLRLRSRLGSRNHRRHALRCHADAVDSRRILQLAQCAVEACQLLLDLGLDGLQSIRERLSRCLRNTILCTTHITGVDTLFRHFCAPWRSVCNHAIDPMRSETHRLSPACF